MEIYVGKFDISTAFHSTFKCTLDPSSANFVTTLLLASITALLLVWQTDWHCLCCC